jgi:hypothetical protein
MAPEEVRHPADGKGSVTRFIHGDPYLEFSHVSASL